MLVHEFVGLSKLEQWPNQTDFVCGCEYEVEDVLDYPANEYAYRGIIVEEDHSLRNNGKEFKSKPQTFQEQLETFNLLHKTLITGKNKFSERTSVHVHVNVLSLSLEKLKQFVLLYALVEPLFFEYVGEERKHNIYCVPLSHTYLPSLYKLPMKDILRKWHKYTALNLIPVAGGNGSSTLGTVEFRHMYGTGSTKEFSEFLLAIYELYGYVVCKPENWKVVDCLETLDKQLELVRDAVPTLSARHTIKNLLTLVENSVIDVKLSEIV